MPAKYLIKPSQYHDSVTLMEAARELTQLPGVTDAAVVMGTDANKRILREAGLLLPEIEAATANDLVVVVQARSAETADRALEAAGKRLARPVPQARASERLAGPTRVGPAFQPRTIHSAVRANPGANLAVISVAGRHAAAEAWEALGNGLHVLLFSDNVPIEDEIALKKHAVERGLLMMGPDCGTAIINGVALGFANAVPRGPVGIVSAAGTGLQEVSTLLAKLGVGISQAIGTGGRDTTDPVGGIMMLEGIRALQADPQTAVMVAISKPPSPAVARRVLERIGASSKPTVTCFLGQDPDPIDAAGSTPASTLQEAAYLAAAAVEGAPVTGRIEREEAELGKRALELRQRLQPGQRYLRGLFSGGTLAAEALVVWKELLGSGRRAARSNVATDPRLKLEDATHSEGNCAVDLGEDEFTVGRLHPMIDNELRIRRLMQEADDPEVAAIVLDVVLGYGAHPDPASELGLAIRQAQVRAANAGRPLAVIASVTGTEEDPQGLGQQVQALEGAGAVICTCNAAAARLAGLIVAAEGAASLLYGKDEGRIVTQETIQREGKPGDSIPYEGKPGNSTPCDTATGRASPPPAGGTEGGTEGGRTSPPPAGGTAGGQTSPLLAGGTEGGLQSLFGAPLNAVNVGLRSFAQSLQAQSVPVTQVDWRPPLVPKLRVTRRGVDIDAANAAATRRIIEGRPTLVGMGIARQVIPGYHDRLILHAGPPITWERMCGPQRGAVMGALVYEGLAQDEQEATQLAASGEIEFAPCHHYHAVGPMAGIISPSMPVFIVKNETFSNVAYATQNEGLGRVLRYGAYGPDVYERLRWMEAILYPTLKRAIESIKEGIDLRALISQALHMGDECHNRNRAGTSLFLRAITPAIVRTCPDREQAAQVFEFIEGNDHFFLNLSMPAGKATLEPAEGIEGATVLTVMARNGTDFGVRMAGEPDRWFVAPAGVVDGLYLPGFTAQDANPDIGDSTVTETAGFGGFAMAAAPAIARFVGGTPEDALQATLEMYEICFTEHEHFTIPDLNFRGTPLGIDVRKVAETGILPRLNTGIAHKEPGIGMVGAGVLRAPERCFADAFEAVQQW